MNKKIDVNTVIGFLLIGGIFLYFGYYNQPDKPLTGGEQADSTEVVEETQDFEEEADAVIAEVPDSLKNIPTEGKEEIFQLENDVVELSISTKGGQIVKARLKDYRTYDSLPLYLINQNSEFNIKLGSGRDALNTADLYFSGSKTSDGNVVMRLNTGQGELEYEYSLSPSNYMLDWQITSDGMEDLIGSETGLQWEMQSFRLEKSRENENQYTRIKYMFEEDDIDELSSTGEDQEEVADLKWLAYKQQFFSSILLHKQEDVNRAVLASRSFDDSDPDYLNHFVSKVSLGNASSDLNVPLGLYLGPNKYGILEAYDRNFEELIPLGWGILGWINRGIVINVFNWLEDYGLNYGIIILIIALLIKMILFPLTYQSYRSMAKMRVLKPEIDELNEKYKDKEPMKKQQAMMELYQKAGVNPIGGCIPVVLQLPILIALFRFFPASIELRQQPFLWAEDLSTYDSIAQLPFHIPFYGDHVSLFTLLMTVSTLIYTYMNNQLSGSNQQYPQMKYIMYLMPIVFLGVFNNYAAGLSYYYFVANMITFGQQFIIRSTLNDEKIHAKIQAKREQPKKENRFMRRMREMQEEQNRQARRRK